MTLRTKLGRAGIATVILLITCSATVTAAKTQTKVNQSALVLADFGRRVGDYIKLRNSVKTDLHGLKARSSAQAIADDSSIRLLPGFDERAPTRNRATSLLPK